jgi:hypothetical protein
LFGTIAAAGEVLEAVDLFDMSAKLGFYNLGIGHIISGALPVVPNLLQAIGNSYSYLVGSDSVTKGSTGTDAGCVAVANGSPALDPIHIAGIVISFDEGG